MTEVSVELLHRLALAIDADNIAEDLVLRDSRSAAEVVSGHDHPHLQLAESDFRRHWTEPITALRSDSVASQLENMPGRINVVVGRMVVARGPWPGHYGLEMAAYTCERAQWPPWFPDTEDELNICLGTLVAASRAFRDGHAAVVFPELLSVERRLGTQSFGTVFPIELTRALNLTPLGTDLSSEHDFSGLAALRTTAFLAHEWGHLSMPGRYADATTRRKPRPCAVIEEVYADISAILMLINSARADAHDVAKVLVAARLGDLRLRRPDQQVDAIAAGHLSVLLAGASGAPNSAQQGLDDDALVDVLTAHQIELLRVIESTTSYESNARRLLTEFGWQESSGRFTHPQLARPM